MSSVQAKTYELIFTARVASFSPIKERELVVEFSEWLALRGHKYNFIVYRVSLKDGDKE